MTSIRSLSASGEGRRIFAQNTGGAMSPDMGMMSDHMDQGMAANHHLEVHVAQADSGSVVRRAS